MPVATGGLVALGRDLRAVAALQQRLVRAQQSLEADYSRLRQAELRYRLMFQLAGEPVLILDAATLQVTDANPAAAALLGLGGGLVQGEPLDRVLPGAAAAVVAGLVARQASSAAPEEATIRLAGGRQLVATASLLREEGGVQALVRLRPSAAREPGAADAASSSQLMDLIASLPDAFVVTTPSGAVVASNPAFAAMVQLASVAQAQDQPLERWLGRGSVDWHVLRDHLRGAGAIRLYATTLRDGHGGTLDVEISAVAVSGQGEDCLGFVIRHVGRRLATAVGESRLAPQAVEQLAGLVGRVPMKDLVRETAELIERMCIEAALHLTGNSRASAAEILGLSRQSLYVKLNRYGIGRGEAGAAADADGDRD
jgi:transcriptional regulator PpsR